MWVFPGDSDGKASACNAGDPASIPGLERSPEEGNGNLLQYSYLENSMDRGAWLATVRRITESDTTERLTLDVDGARVWWRSVSVSWNIHFYHCHLAGLAWPAGPSALFTPWMLFVPVLVWWLPGTVHVFKQHEIWDRINLLVYNTIARDWLRWFQKIWSKMWLFRSLHFLRRRVRLTPARFLFVCSLFLHPFIPTI